MKAHRVSLVGVLALQVVVAAAVAGGWAGLSELDRARLRQAVGGDGFYPVVPIASPEPLRVAPLYDDPGLVTDEELAAVLWKVRPRFPRQQLRPNFIEHALRVWGLEIDFDDPEVLSGAEMMDFLVDHGKYLASWGDEVEPILEDRPQGVAIRWESEQDASVHHDHWLASLTEAGITLDEPVFTPSRRDMTIYDALQEAVRDFRLDEREVEWSAMAFGFWLAPTTRTWTADDGRRLSFDQLARRLMRGDMRFGVCDGTHRVYSLVVLVRLDDAYGILSPEVRSAIHRHLERVRDLIAASQFEDGHWPSNWPKGADAVRTPVDDPDYKQVIATGHHLEWLAIAPAEFHPPREQVRRAARWIIRHTLEQDAAVIEQRYTFYSHVGNALALWRNTHAADFWRQWHAGRGPSAPVESDAEIDLPLP